MAEFHYSLPILTLLLQSFCSLPELLRPEWRFAKHSGREQPHNAISVRHHESQDAENAASPAIRDVPIRLAWASIEQDRLQSHDDDDLQLRQHGSVAEQSAVEWHGHHLHLHRDRATPADD